jgi:membrane associated rhomboid family serine protease
LYLGVSGQSIFCGGGIAFAHVGGALFGFLIMWYWRRISLMIIGGTKQFRLEVYMQKKDKE